jgi:glycosyltransferase involved in cell wall biosynthesis
MKILYIWDADYPWDIRADKITNTLMINGFDVHIAARNLKKLPEYEFVNGVHIHRLKAWESNRINYLYSFPLFFSPIWNGFLNQLVKKNKIDLIIVRDLPLCVAGVWTAKRNGIPVIFDMAEDYPAMNRDIWRAQKFQGFNFVLRMPIISILLEKLSLKMVNHVLVVVHESTIRLVNLGVKESKITLVSNTPVIDKSTINKQNNKYEKFTVVYTGGIQMGRGIQTVIKALPLIAKKIPNIEFKIIGDGYARSQLMELSKELNVDHYTDWMGFVEHEKLYDIIGKCHVGIIPHYSSEHTDSTIPNKIFDYMYMAVPILSAKIPPIERILSEEKCGFVYEDRNEDELASRLYDLYRDKNYLPMGTSGRLSVLEKYNWEKDTIRLLKAVGSTLPQKG